MKIFKIPHPWWHIFFTEPYLYMDSVVAGQYRCSKCHKIYVFEAVYHKYETVVIKK